MKKFVESLSVFIDYLKIRILKDFLGRFSISFRVSSSATRHRLIMNRALFLLIISYGIVVEPRMRRHTSHYLPLSKAVNTSLCPYIVKVDEDPNRIPPRIERVQCKDLGGICHPLSPMACCTELYTTMKFLYLDTKDIHEDKVEIGCVCNRPKIEKARKLNAPIDMTNK